MPKVNLTLRLRKWTICNAKSTGAGYVQSIRIQEGTAAASSASCCRQLQLDILEAGKERSFEMHCVADFCVIPMGVDAGVSKWIAEAQKVLEKSGLNYEMHGYGYANLDLEHSQSVS